MGIRSMKQATVRSTVISADVSCPQSSVQSKSCPWSGVGRFFFWRQSLGTFVFFRPLLSVHHFFLMATKRNVWKHKTLHHIHTLFNQSQILLIFFFFFFFVCPTIDRSPPLQITYFDDLPVVLIPAPLFDYSWSIHGTKNGLVPVE